jgi:hypothetical protein
MNNPDRWDLGRFPPQNPAFASGTIKAREKGYWTLYSAS